MVKTIGLLAITAGKNIVQAMLTRKMLLWALEKYTKSTDTQLDDGIFNLVQAGLDNNPEKVREAVKEVAEAWLA